MKTLSLALLVALLIVPVGAQTLDADLQRAVQKEIVSGDLKGAIEEYRRIAARAGEHRAVKAKALLRMADAYRKLGDAESRKLYEQVVKEFADQQEAVAEARTRLGAAVSASRGPSGPAARQVWSGQEVDMMGQISADGRILTYTDWITGDLAIRDLATGVNRRLTNTGGWEASGDFAEFSVPSPDGREVAYAWFTETRTGATNYNLRFLAVSDAARPRIAARPDDLEWIMPCAWTPDGKHVVVFRERIGRIRELGLVDAATGAFRLLKTLESGPNRASVSPDGRWIAYDGAPSGNGHERDLFVINVDGSGDARIEASPSNDQMPMWTPDGSHVLFVSDRTGTDGLWSIPVRAGTSSGPAVMVKQDVGAFYPLGLTRTGAVAYFVGGDRMNNYVAGIDAGLKITSPPVPLTSKFVNSNIGASWSPDGRQVAFIAFRGRGTAGATLVVRTVSSGEEREIPLNLHIQRGNLGPVRWFPDGRSVLVVSLDAREEGLRYSRVTLASGAVDLLHRTRRRGPAFAAPVLTPDGSAIIYIDSAESDVSVGEARTAIRRFDLASRQDVVLERAMASSLSLSPDGRHIAYVFRDSPQSRETQIGIMPVGGGDTRVIFRTVWLDGTRFNTLGWSRDGRFVLFVQREANGDHHLVRVPAEGGAPEKTGLTANRQMKAPQISPDGTRLLYSVRDLTENAVWILENFLPSRAGTLP